VANALRNLSQALGQLADAFDNETRSDRPHWFGGWGWYTWDPSVGSAWIGAHVVAASAQAKSCTCGTSVVSARAVVSIYTACLTRNPWRA